MKAVDEIDLELGVVRIAFLEFVLVLLEVLYVFIGPVPCSQPGYLGLEEPPHLNDLEYEIGIEPQVIEEMERVDGVFDLQFR